MVKFWIFSCSSYCPQRLIIVTGECLWLSVVVIFVNFKHLNEHFQLKHFKMIPKDKSFQNKIGNKKFTQKSIQFVSVTSMIFIESDKFSINSFSMLISLSP